MTTVKQIKTDGRLLITVKGHTGLVKEQVDVGCAAVSMLVSLLVTAMRIEDSCGHLEYLVVKTDSGDVKLDIAPLPEYKERLEVVADTVFLGFRMLAAEYPEYVILEDK